MGFAAHLDGAYEAQADPSLAEVVIVAGNGAAND
jgi:hypothetical protein